MKRRTEVIHTLETVAGEQFIIKPGVECVELTIEDASSEFSSLTHQEALEVADALTLGKVRDVVRAARMVLVAIDRQGALIADRQILQGALEKFDGFET